jgi:hypothetical protein
VHQIDQMITRIAKDLQMFVGNRALKNEIAFVNKLPTMPVGNQLSRCRLHCLIS